MTVENGGGDTQNPGATELGGNPAGDPAASADFLSGLSDEQKAFATEQGFDSPAKVIDGYKNLNTKLSGAIVPPGDEATPEQREEFYKTVSAKWTPADGYQFKMPEGLDEKFPYDPEFAKEAGEWFKEAGLHPAAAQALHDKWVGKMSEAYGQSAQEAEAATQKQAEAVETAHRELVKEYGDPATEGYKNLVAKADRAMQGLKQEGIDVSAWFAEKGILTAPDETGLQQVTDPTAVKMLAFLHDKALSEDGLNGLGGGDQSNPFVKGSENLTTQSQLIRDNPGKAASLIKAAGGDPTRWGLKA